MLGFAKYIKENWSRWGDVSEKEFTLNTKIGPLTYRIQASVRLASFFPQIQQIMQSVNGPFDPQWKTTKFDFGVAKGTSTDYKLTDLGNGTAVIRNVIGLIQEYLAIPNNKTPYIILESYTDNLEGRMSTYLSIIMRYTKQIGYSPFVLDAKSILLISNEKLEHPDDSEYLNQNAKNTINQWKSYHL